MKQLFKIMILVLVSLNLSAQADFSPFVDGLEFLGDSGIVGPSYADQIELLNATAEKYPHVATSFSYGQSVGGKPLSGIIFSLKDQRQIKKMILITGATHGNEYLNIVDQLPNALAELPRSYFSRYIQEGGAVIFVPIFNPDGYEARRRRNSNGADLNRDFPNPLIDLQGFRQPESLYLAQFIEGYQNQNNKKFEIAMDYHCCVSGMLLIPWGYTNKHMTAQEMQLYTPMIESMESSFPKPGAVGTPPDLLYSARGTTLDYWFQRYGAISMTYEGSYGSENRLINNHVLWWERMFSQLLSVKH